MLKYLIRKARHETRMSLESIQTMLLSSQSKKPKYLLTPSAGPELIVMVFLLSRICHNINYIFCKVMRRQTNKHTNEKKLITIGVTVHTSRLHNFVVIVKSSLSILFMLQQRIRITSEL